MNELYELNPTPQEAVLQMLPYDHAALAHKLGLSIEFVKNYGADCAASLAGERERLICVEAVTGEAVQHSLDRQEKLSAAYTELADAGNVYIALLDTKKETEVEAGEKQGQLTLEQANQEKLNVSAKELQGRISESAANQSRGSYLSGLHEGRDRLGSSLFYSGVKISQLQSEIDGIRIEELPALEAKIATQLEHIMKLHAAVSAIVEEIEHLPAPADDPKNHDLYRVSGGARHYQRAIDTTTPSSGRELPQADNSQNELPTSRPRKIGVTAVQLVEEGGILKRILVNMRPSRETTTLA